MSRSLHDAILSKNEEEVVTRLNMGEDVNQSHPPRYSSPLHTAVYSGNAGVVELLLCRGAAPSMGDREGVTPLAIATSQGKQDIVTMISNAGGTKTPSSLPTVDDKPDPLFSHPPPWKDQTITQVKNKENAESVKPKESLYGFLKKGTKVMSSKPIKAVSDSSKKPGLEIDSKNDEKTKKCPDNSTAQNVHVTFPGEKKIPTCQTKESAETGHIEILNEESASEINDLETIKENEASNGKHENQNITKDSRGMYASFRKKLSKKKPINQDNINSEHPKSKSLKLKKLQEKMSLRLSKGNKETKVAIDEIENDNKAKETSASIEKFKRLLSSSSNKQTMKKNSDPCFSDHIEEKIIETNQENLITEIGQTNKKNLNITNKLESLKVYKQKLFKNNKSNKQEENNASTEKEATIVTKIKNQFESSKSKLLKNKKDTIEQSNEKKTGYKIDSIRKRCSTVFKKDDQDKNNVSDCKENNNGQVNKASTTLKSFKLRLSYKGKTNKEEKENGDKILKDKTLQNQAKKDSMKSKFSNIFPKGRETKPENKASEVMSINIEKHIMSTKESQLRKRDTKYQWIMIDGQWRKSESFGL